MRKFFGSLVGLVCAVSHLQAGGAILYEISTADTRLASAGWAARAQDPSTVFTNPAGMSRLCMPQFELGAQAIYNHVRFKPNSYTAVSGTEGHCNAWLPAGSFYYVYPVDDCITLGFGSLGYFGSDLKYNHGWVGRRYVQKLLLEGLSLVPAAAYKFHENWSIGAGFNIMYSFYKQRTAVNNLLDVLPDGYFTLHDYRWGLGGVFGILYEHSPCTRFGIQYLTSVKLNLRDKPHFHNIGPQLTDILRRIGIIGSSVNMHIRVPQSVMLSAYHDLNCYLTVMADLGWQQWSRFEQATIALADLNQNSFHFKGKFKDTWHAAFGAEWRCNDDLTFSGGVAYDSSAVSNSERQLNFPVGRQWRFGTGFRYYFPNCMTFDFSTELLWQGNLKADVNKGTLSSRVAGSFKDTYAVFTSLNLTYVF
jgi:long-chain fatty acid transport protein